MKRIVCLIVCFIALWGNSTTVSASKNECSHNYNATYDGHSFVCDICSWCGYENLHKSDCHQSFVTRIDNVVSRTGPRKSAKIVNRYADSGYALTVVGRIRNEYNNLWLQLSDGSFIYADNVAYDFSHTISEAAASLGMMSRYACNLGYTNEFGFGSVCGQTIASKYTSMFAHFNPWTVLPYNLKVDGLLGNTYDYYVFVDGNVLDSRYRGEQLGNILYGYICQKEGFSFEEAVRYSGFAMPNGFFDMVNCVFMGQLDKCDDPEDINMVQLGWNYANNDNWNESGD